MMLPAIHDPRAGYALYEAANLAQTASKMKFDMSWDELREMTREP